MILWNFWKHAGSYKVAGFCFSLIRISNSIAGSCISPTEGHYCSSPILCPNDLVYHSDFHFHKSSTNQKSEMNIENVIFKWKLLKIILATLLFRKNGTLISISHRSSSSVTVWKISSQLNQSICGDPWCMYTLSLSLNTASSASFATKKSKFQTLPEIGRFHHF